VARLLEPFEEGFDLPAEVIPRRNLGIAHGFGQSTEQIPFGKYLPVRTMETAHHPAQRSGAPGIGAMRLGLALRVSTTGALAIHCVALLPLHLTWRVL
jgi:hypothetical protein